MLIGPVASRRLATAIRLSPRVKSISRLSRRHQRRPSPSGHHVLSLIHISEPTRLGMISYAVFCLKKKNTVLVTQQSIGDMAANDEPVPVQTLAHTARVMRNARQLGQYGVVINDPALDYLQ